MEVGLHFVFLAASMLSLFVVRPGAAQRDALRLSDHLPAEQPCDSPVDPALQQSPAVPGNAFKK